MIEFINKFLVSLTDSELDFFQSAAWKENERRAAIKRAAFGSGLPKLTDQEKRLAGYDKLNAIKAYRLRTGCSLKEAKDEVEDYITEIDAPTPPPSDPPPSEPPYGKGH